MRYRLLSLPSLLLVTLALSSGCAPGDADRSPGTTPRNASAESTPAPSPTLETARGVGLGNARMPVEGLVTAAQPSESQMEALAAAGFENFISLRPTVEQGAGWEEAHAQGRDYAFRRLPVSGADDLTRERVEAFAAMLEEAGDEPTVLYCASSNRVGAMLALKAYWLDGVPAEEALALGRAGGLTRLEGAVRERMGQGG